MHIDARSLSNNSVIEGDICIIGAGAAGISIALEWKNSPYNIILLEGGGFDYDDKVQELYAGKTTGQKYFPLKSARLHYFGGTTGHWAGQCSTFDEIDFEKRDWVPHSGWPIKRSDLDPYYARAHTILNLGTYEYDWKFWQRKDPSLKPLLNNESVVWNKIWQFSTPTARFGTQYRADILNAANIHLYTYADVVDMTANESITNIQEVTVRNYAGRAHRVKAKYFILACGAIQNARVLLASNKQAPNGIGNDNDNVGRYFMEHVEIDSAELWLTRPNPMKLYFWNFGSTRTRCELSIHSNAQREFKILNGTCSFNPLSLARRTPSAMETWNSDDPRESLKNYVDPLKKLSDDKKANAEAKMGKAYQLYTRIEQAPNPLSRITLDTEKDSLGVPRVILHWELTSLEKRSIRKIAELIGQQVGLENVGRVKLMDYFSDENDTSWPAATAGGWHHMGTTRMSDDPKNGVVDANCKVHGISNLFVAGSSCYVTAAAPNPTLTLVALSLRLSDYIKRLM